MKKLAVIYMTISLIVAVSCSTQKNQIESTPATLELANTSKETEIVLKEMQDELTQKDKYIETQKLRFDQLKSSFEADQELLRSKEDAIAKLLGLITETQKKKLLESSITYEITINDTFLQDEETILLDTNDIVVKITKSKDTSIFSDEELRGYSLKNELFEQLIFNISPLKTDVFDGTTTQSFVYTFKSSGQEELTMEISDELRNKLGFHHKTIKVKSRN